MNTLAEIAARFARLDGMADDDFAAYAKGLRNLAQRQFLPPSDQQGRVFLYDRAASITIRLAQIAHEFGLPRLAIDALTHWLHEAGERRDGDAGVSHAAEAIQRVVANETFALHVIFDSERRYRIFADWTPDTPPSPRAHRALRLAGLTHADEIARFTLPASMLIARVLKG